MRKTRLLAIGGLFAALLAVFSQISIPLPFSPVPLSLGVLAVFLIGGLLPPRLALGSVLAYLAMGVVGIPVFAGFLAGPGRLLGPTGGYLVAYPLMALLVSWGQTRQKTVGFFSLAGWMVLSLGACYLLGTLWMTAYTGQGAWAVLGMAVFPFLPLDLCKALAGAALCLRLRRSLPSLTIAR